MLTAFLLLDGLVCRHKSFYDETHQTILFLRLSNVLGLHTSLLEIMDCGVSRVAPMNVGFPSHYAAEEPRAELSCHCQAMLAESGPQPVTPEFRPVSLDTGSPDEQGLLVFMAGRLVAVLVRLSEQHGDQAGHWFLEHGFGRISRRQRPSFADISGAERWIRQQFNQQ